LASGDNFVKIVQKITFQGTMLTFVSLLATFSGLQAQRPTNFGQGSGYRPAQSQNQPQTQDTGPDSTVYNYIYLSDINVKYQRTDTMADIAFMQNNMLINGAGDYINTGNFGSSIYPLLFRPNISTNFFTGYNQYKIYQITSDNFRFYEQNRPLSDLYFSQIGNQENINVRADFSRNFSDGLSVSLNFARISQKGFFTGQDVKNTAFGMGFRYKSPSDKYNAFLLVFHNATEESHLGGITNPDELLAEFNKDLTSVLSQANTRNQQQEYSLIQNLNLTGTHKSGFKLYLKNDLKFKPSYYKFADNLINDSNDSSFYAGISTDIRGIRRYVTVNHISNGFYINGEKTGGINGRLGLLTDYFNVKDGDASSFGRLDLTATFDGQLPIGKTLMVETTGKLGIGKNIGNFDLGGMVNFNVGKIGTLNGKLRFFRSENPYNANRLVINNLMQIDNSFAKPFGTEFGGDLYIKSLKLKATVTQTVINNPVYFGKDGRPAQSGEVFSASRLSIIHQLRLGHFHLDNSAHFQLFSSNLYALPPLYSTHQLYYKGAWFKKEMHVNAGFDVRLIPDYKGPGFHPLYGAFHVTDSDLFFYPAAHFFFLARVSSFRAMILMENITQSITDDYNFDVVGHPQNEMKLRFGIQWLLKD
jgi:hypothetical protein